MPSPRSRAAFKPIPPDVDIKTLLGSFPNLEFVTRIHCDSIDELGLENFEKMVLGHVILGGKPLVVEGFNERLDNSLFSEQWLRDHYSSKIEVARNLSTKADLPLSIGHYFNNMPLLTNQWNEYNYQDKDKQRLYLKDIDCPAEWHHALKKVIPPSLFYLNQSPGAFQGPGAKTTPSHGTPATHSSSGLPVAKAGDLMSCLPPNMRAQNLMCYIGHEGTYTPAHQEMCASLGQNIMVEASDGSIEHGKSTKRGSSIWFMTESKDRGVVSEYWMSILGHDIDIEDHFAQIKAWKHAPFKTYIVEQRPGDFILIPPLAAHQVWNRGTRTMKVAWNRTTVQTLGLALNVALPHARMVCRDEQYKNKAIVYYSLKHYSALLKTIDKVYVCRPRVQQLMVEFEDLFNLFTQILSSENLRGDFPKKKDIEYIPFESNITCSYCRGNIFNRFLTCPWCVGEDDDTYDICMECYVMGRSCACVSKLKWAEQFRWNELISDYDTWRHQLIELSGCSNEDYPTLSTISHSSNKKTLAETCLEQLKMRPWVDITIPVVPRMEELVSDAGSISPSRKRRKVCSSGWPKKGGRCHICKSAEPMWKLASCSSCHLKYCYGSLFRAFNIRPQDVMEVYHWKCPKCEKFCSCAACRRDSRITPFEPTCTLLGHDTRRIADPRSVEVLFDYRQSNLRWLKKAADDEVKRFETHHEEADEKRTQSLIEHSIQLERLPPTTDQNVGDIWLPDPVKSYHDDIPLDPALVDLDGSLFAAQSVPLSR